MTDARARKKIFDLQLLKRILGFASPYRGKFYMAIFLAILTALLTPVRPLLIQISISEGLQDKFPGRLLDGPGGFLIEITILQIFLLASESFIKFYFSLLSSGLGQSVIRDIRQKTYRKVLGLNLTQFDKTPIGTLTTRTINDIESINDIFSDGLIPILADLLTILSVLTYMFWSDWQISLVCLVPFPILIIATYFFKESVNRSFIKVRNAVSALNAFVQEHITGMSLVQAFAAEEQEQQKFRKINSDHRNANIKAIFAYSVFFPVVELVSALSVALLVWWSAHHALDLPSEKAGEVTGLVTSFILCLNLLFRPLRILADKFNVLQMGMIASERVFKVLDNEDVTKDEGIFRPEEIKGEIAFNHVFFSYNEEKDVLKNLNLHIRQGETLAIVGHTGSGKTSLTALISRMYQPQKGEILLDGRSIREYPLAVLRSCIGTVLQDVFLFSGSIRDNLTLRNPDIPFEKVKEACQLIDIHEFIMNLPGGYDFEVKERGMTLSMGQRQLISFARTLLYNPAILVLDEATSSIDTESELLIQKAIEKLIAGRTSIIIAHRLSTIRKADRIIVLDKGEIREQGTHEQLLSQNGLYSRLHSLQFD